MGIFGDIVRSVNQATGALPVRVFVNQKIARYGKMTELKIDPDQKTISATLQLKGEAEPIHLRVADYNLHHDGKSDVITVGQVTVSREWMQALATDFVVGKAWVLPAGVGKWMRMVM